MSGPPEDDYDDMINDYADFEPEYPEEEYMDEMAQLAEEEEAVGTSTNNAVVQPEMQATEAPATTDDAASIRETWASTRPTEQEDNDRHLYSFER